MGRTIECENCGGAIGKLETPRVWNDQCVCASCHSKLSGNLEMTAPAPPPLPVVVHHVNVRAPRKHTGLIGLGILIMLASFPLACVGGLGFFLFPVGLIIMIIGLCS